MKRAWILLENGELKEIPRYLVEREHMTWPPGLHEKKPAEPTRHHTLDDMYRRHEVTKDTAYVFMRDTEANSYVPSDVVDRIRRLIKGSD